MVVTDACVKAAIFFTKSLIDYTAHDLASLPTITKGGLKAVTRSLAMEYATEGTRFAAVVNKPMGEIPDDDFADAIVYSTEARQVTGEVLHMNAGAHNGKW
jgi:enoyl-[acyl-carrier-protein] reductase (NADH)